MLELALAIYISLPQPALNRVEFVIVIDVVLWPLDLILAQFFFIFFINLFIHFTSQLQHLSQAHSYQLPPPHPSPLPQRRRSSPWVAPCSGLSPTKAQPNSPAGLRGWKAGSRVRDVGWDEGIEWLRQWTRFAFLNYVLFNPFYLFVCLLVCLLCVCVCVCVCVWYTCHCPHWKVGGQLSGVGFLLLYCRL